MQLEEFVKTLEAFCYILQGVDGSKGGKRKKDGRTIGWRNLGDPRTKERTRTIRA